MFRTLKQLLFAVVLLGNVCAQQNVEIKVLRGAAIIPYVETITKLCLDGFQEYHYKRIAADYEPYVKSYTQSGIVCLLFENKKPVGFIAGMPLQHMRSNYKKPWLEKTTEEVTPLFYIGELVVLKEYQKRGYGTELFHAIEPHITKLKKIKKICCCRFGEHASLDAGFIREGFVKYDEIECNVNGRNINMETKAKNKRTFWVKSLK